MKKASYILIFSLLTVFADGQESNLIDFIPSACDQNEDVERIRDRVSDFHFQNDTLYISVEVVANCSFNDEPSGFALYKEDTLYLGIDYSYEIEDSVGEGGEIIHTISHSVALCDCCFEYIYLVRDVPIDTIPIKFNHKFLEYNPEKYKTYPLSYDIIESDTINRVDKYGFRQGLWLRYNDNGQLIMRRLYQNDSIVKGTDYRYYDNGNLKEKLEWYNDGHDGYYEYDDKGNLTSHKKSPFEN